jgi:hypothetical protein
MEEKSILSNAVNILKSKGFEHIQADGEEYERPAKLIKKGTDMVFTPDLTAEQNHGKCYFEIVRTAKRDKSKLIDKWSLLSAMAKHKNGHFFLLVPDSKMNYAQKILKEERIDAEIIKM